VAVAAAVAVPLTRLVQQFVGPISWLGDAMQVDQPKHPVERLVVHLARPYIMSDISSQQ
jgi:hypothetical protein